MRCFATLSLFLLALPVSAQEERPAASLLSTAASEGVRDGFSGAVDRMIRAKVDELGVLAMRGAVALDISEVQLALGCVGETPECLGPVAQQLEVQVLLLPNLDRVGDEIVLSVARFDATTGELSRVVRRASGEDAETEILDDVDGLLRELFGLPAPPEEDVAPVRPPSREPQIAGPAIIAAVGAAALIGAIAPAVLFLDEQAAFEEPVVTEMDAEEREMHRANADTLAIAANVLFIAGGVIAGAGLVWLIVEIAAPSGGAPAETAVVPIVGPNVAGVAAQGVF